ncbi:MAG: ComEC/Rec2 family competence protein [Bacteroides sp.]|nr:ComEC/Rec2 family competence protein [Bacteroides sp.]
MPAAYLRRHPLLRLLLALLPGMAVGAYFPLEHPALLFPLCLIGLGVLYLLCRRRGVGWHGAAALLAFFLLGMGLVSHALSRTAYPFADAETVCRVRLVDHPEEKERSYLCRSLLLDEWRGDSLHLSGDGHLFLLYFPKDSAVALPARGDELLVHTRLTLPVGNGLPEEFDYARFLRYRGVSGTAYVPRGRWKRVGHQDVPTFAQRMDDMRDSVLTHYRRLGFRDDELAVLAALTVGSKEELSDEIRETYSVAGASHVLALSGLHVGLLYGVLWLLFSPCWRLVARLRPYVLLLIVALLWFFAYFTGLSPSVVRAVAMCSCWALSCLLPGRPRTSEVLTAAAFLMLLFRPLWLFDVGFQLSFAAVAAILLLQPWLEGLWRPEGWLKRKVWSLLTLSVAAQVGTAPLVAYYFSRFSVHFLLTNLWVIPLVTLVMYLALVLFLLTPFPAVQQLVATVLQWLLSLQHDGLRLIEQLPGASVDRIWLPEWQLLFLYLLLVLLYRACRHCTPRRLALFLVALLLFLSLRLLLQSRPQAGVVFYSVQRCPVVHCLTEGRESWLVCADSLPDTSRLRRSLGAHWNRLGLLPPTELSGDTLLLPADSSGDTILPRLSLQQGILSYRGLRVCLLTDDRWRGLTADRPLPVDYLYVCRGFRGRLADLTALFRVRVVVLDASLGDYASRRYIEECRRLRLPYAEMKTRGMLMVGND